MHEWLHQHHLIALFLAILLISALANHRSIQPFTAHSLPAAYPRLSVLIPARNEAHTIQACLESLLNQDYPDYEVIVLNDHSTDETPQIVWQMCQKYPRLRLIEGAPLPEGWLGKHWACHQLAQVASGDLLLFTDADTRHAPTTLRESVNMLLEQRLDLLTALPAQTMHTWGEKLVVPMVMFGPFLFLPLALAHRLQWSPLVLAVGQFMLFRRLAFEAIGGYAAVRHHAVDDVAVARRLVGHGFRWRLADGSRHISTRMYRSLSEAIDGFTKNIFPFFGYRLLLFLIAWYWIAIAFLSPILSFLAHLLYPPLAFYPFSWSLLEVLQTLLLFRVVYLRFHLPTYMALLYPIHSLMLVWIGARSLLFTLTGQATWKDRKLVYASWRLW